jgi:hypothetical protein
MVLDSSCGMKLSTRQVQARNGVFGCSPPKIRGRNPQMLSVLRSRCSWFIPLWSCGLILVSSYVLFDLLDIDGSDLRSIAESRTVAEESQVSKGAGKDFSGGFFTSWPREFPLQSHALVLFANPLAPASSFTRPGFFRVRPRSAIAESIASSPRSEADPPKQSA